MSKLNGEKAVYKFSLATENKVTSLRFFNVIGAAAPELSDNSKDNLLPIVISKLSKKEAVEIFGTDYNTEDGTCVRDYVDVRDIARAHLLVIKHKGGLPPVLNVGTGLGVSVREFLQIVSDLYEDDQLRIIESRRRAGDAEYVCADISRIQRHLNFKSQYGIRESIASVFSNSNFR
jgi:UDP-glucose 4-epimerase